MTKHAKRFSPSASSRWLTCTASVKYIEDLRLRQIIPDESPSSPAAEEGTKAHSALEYWLKHGEPPEGADDEMREHVEIAVNYAKEKQMDGYIVASEVSLIIPQTGDVGTADLLLLNTKKKHLIVADYKHGFEFVDVHGNTQLMLYALGALTKLMQKGLGDVRITLAIIQPRVYGQAPIREWEFQNPDEFANRVSSTLRSITDNDTLFLPEEKACRWCPAAAHCAARAQAVVAEFDDNATDTLPTPEHLPAIDHLSDADVATFMRALPFISAWLKDLEARAYNLATQNKLAGYKLVEGRSVRKWSDDIEAAFAERGVDIDKYMPRKLVGITDGQKLIPAKERKQFMDSHTTKQQGKPVIVPADDKRPALEHVTAEEYNNDLDD